ILSLHEFAGREWRPQPDWTILTEQEIVDGVDELGVLLYGHTLAAYSYRSQLSIEECGALAPYQNATGLQVTAAILVGIVWAIENPSAGVVEADEMDFARCLEIQEPYMGPLVGAYTSWSPLDGREALFEEDIDRDDPWRFQNFIVR
ncbi:MAG TPA: saccharopine dehydrogenase C-terminal domain-containing protein, partial [Beijerinckiaceae bacterium]